MRLASLLPALQLGATLALHQLAVAPRAPQPCARAAVQMSAGVGAEVLHRRR